MPKKTKTTKRTPTPKSKQPTPDRSAPTTRDGVPAVEGMTIFYPNGKRGFYFAGLIRAGRPVWTADLPGRGRVLPHVRITDCFADLSAAFADAEGLRPDAPAV